VRLKPKRFIEDVLSAWMLRTLDDDGPGENQSVTQQAEQGISCAAIVALIGAVDSCRAQATRPRQKAHAFLSAGPLSTWWSITYQLVLDACGSCHVAPWTENFAVPDGYCRLN
jgi:hypothetical protein